MRFFVICLFFALAPMPTLADTPKIVTDIPVVHSLVSMVTGDPANLDLLVTGNADPHHFQMRPFQARMLAKANIIFGLGEALTPWIGQARETLAQDARFVALNDTLTAEFEDPHTWLDPENAQNWLLVIAKELSIIDPENAALYRQNAARHQAEIYEIQVEMTQQISGTQPHNIVVSHDAYTHLENRFPIHVLGALSDHDDQPASAARLREIRDAANENEISCAFYGALESPKLINSVVGDLDLPISQLDIFGSDIEPGPSLYPTLLRRLANDISTCRN